MKGLPYAPACDDQHGHYGKERGWKHRNGNIGKGRPKALHCKQEQRPGEKGLRQTMNDRNPSDTTACVWVVQTYNLSEIGVNRKCRIKGPLLCSLRRLHS